MTSEPMNQIKKAPWANQQGLKTTTNLERYELYFNYFIVYVQLSKIKSIIGIITYKN
jgi:hypothetical protein